MHGKGKGRWNTTTIAPGSGGGARNRSRRAHGDQTWPKQRFRQFKNRSEEGRSRYGIVATCAPGSPALLSDGQISKGVIGSCYDRAEGSPIYLDPTAAVTSSKNNKRSCHCGDHCGLKPRPPTRSCTRNTNTYRAARCDESTSNLQYTILGTRLYD